MSRTVWFVVLLALMVMLGACKQAGPASTGTPQSGSSTAGQLVEPGKAVFNRSCASCHGAQGQGGAGPALIGTGEGLKKYGDAQKLYEKISTTMPQSAPGSLSQEDYLRVLSFILVEDNLVQADAPISPDALAGIKLQ
jgi:alcohol dehydrogenase (cytochrome c)